jgi:hypothetical protein
MMRRNVCLVVLFWCAAICFATQKQPRAEDATVFALHSWQGDKGSWTFSLLPAVLDAGFHPDVIMHPSKALTGPEKLKKKIAVLPAGSQILWFSHVDGMWKNAKGSEKIKYPPAGIVADIRKFCETKGYKLSVD